MNKLYNSKNDSNVAKDAFETEMERKSNIINGNGDYKYVYGGSNDKNYILVIVKEFCFTKGTTSAPNTPIGSLVHI